MDVFGCAWVWQVQNHSWGWGNCWLPPCSSWPLPPPSTSCDFLQMGQVPWSSSQGKMHFSWKMWSQFSFRTSSDTTKSSQHTEHCVFWSETGGLKIVFSEFTPKSLDVQGDHSGQELRLTWIFKFHQLVGCYFSYLAKMITLPFRIHWFPPPKSNKPTAIN